MTFITQAAKQGQGVAYWLDVSLDKFATVAYRWGTVGGLLDGANVYEDRIEQLGRFSKGFSPDHIAGASTMTVKLENTDRGVDWMVDQATSYKVFYARARLYVGLYDASSGAAPANLASKQLGEFVIAYFPERDDSFVSFTLSDDLLGILNQPVGTPTMDDWILAPGSTNANCPMLAGTFAINRYEMLPLVFGSDWAEARIAGDNPNSTNFGLVVCVTTETALDTATSWNEANMQLGINLSTAVGVIQYATNGQMTGMAMQKFLTVPVSFNLYNVTYTVWTAKTSVTITKGGKSFIVLWVEVNADNFFKWFQSIGINFFNGTWTKETILQNITAYYVKDAQSVSQGLKLSGRTQFAAKTHVADVIADLITYYSTDGTAANVDAASFTRARSDVSWGQASGAIHPGLDQTPEQRAKGVGAPSRSTLREHVTGIVQAADLDIYVTWDGLIALSSMWNDYTVSVHGVSITNLYAIAEERSNAQMDATPSNGDRWSPYNRILLADVKTDIQTGQLCQSPGPYDNPDPAAQDWKTKLETTWPMGWTPRATQGGNPWYSRHAEQMVRPRFTFITDIEALSKLELGGFFAGNWNRNFTAPAPFNSVVFQVEMIAIDPNDNRVEIEAIWRNETQTDKPYILDDEVLVRRTNNGGGRTATVVDASPTVTFSGGSLIADGVQVGDHLILQDATEAADSFKRNKAVAITRVTDATHCDVSDALNALDFGAGAGIVVATWEIRKSAVTYPTAGSDPVNYPDGGSMYGKIADLISGGVFSDTTAANKLLTG